MIEAIDFRHRLGGAALRVRNAALAAEGAQLVAQCLNTEVGTRGSVAGAMATIRLPVENPSSAHALDIRRRLMEAGTDAPVHALDGALWLRLSAFALTNSTITAAWPGWWQRCCGLSGRLSRDAARR